LRAVAHAVAALPKAVFVGACESLLTVIVAASPDSGVNAGDVLKGALAAHGGRGGGNPKVAQGSVPTAAALIAVVESLSR
jgi:alanyl-tRNA synthetase